MATKTITISLPEELLKKLDIAAQEDFATRSEFFRQAAVERLKYVGECRIKLAAAAQNTDIPTEEELRALLNWRHARRTLNNYFSENGWRTRVPRT